MVGPPMACQPGRPGTNLALDREESPPRHKYSLASASPRVTSFQWWTVANDHTTVADRIVQRQVFGGAVNPVMAG